MKLIWNEPRKPTESQRVVFWELAVRGWLNYMNVWPENDPSYWRCEYNDLYHFFDITIYEYRLSEHGEPRRVIDQMRNFLRNSDLSWEESETWIKDEDGTRPGVRFWIQAEDHKNKKTKRRKKENRRTKE